MTSVRLKKEFRGVLWPWMMAAAAGLLMPVFALCPRPGFGHEVWDFLWGLAFLALCVGGGLVVASPFGSEYQQRTLPLLLVQPVERFRLWRDKLLAVMLALAAVGLLHIIAWIGFGVLGPGPQRLSMVISEANREPLATAVLMIGMVVLATVCSAGFWTMVARSSIGGVVFSVMSMVLTGLGTAAVLHRRYGEELDSHRTLVAVVTAMVGLAYSGTFLWLGWRKFARLELKDAVFGEGIGLGGAAGRSRWWARPLICRPTGNWVNLVRKEVRLQKPVVLAAAAFTICWFVALELHRLWPEHGFNELLGMLLAFDAPLVLILAGSISLSEEKTLGVANWQLTWPVSARRLWIVKLGVANVVGLALGFLVPLGLAILAAATDPSPSSGNLWNSDRYPSAVALALGLAWLTIMVSFWASTMVSNTVKAALLSIAAMSVGGSALIGIWMGESLTGGIQSWLLTRVMVYWQLSPWVVRAYSVGITSLGVVLGGCLVILLLLRQSLVQFRRPEASWRKLLKRGLLLPVIILGGSFWASDFQASVQGLDRAQPVMELELALSHFSSKHALWRTQEIRIVTLEELRRETADLSPLTEAWLKGAVITSRPSGKGFSNPGQKAWWAFFVAEIRFPNGEKYAVGYSANVPPTAEWTKPIR